LLLILPLCSNSQSIEDSLLHQLSVLEEKYHDTIYFELYNNHKLLNPDKSVKYAFKHLENTERYHSIEDQIKSYRLIGTGYNYSGNLDSAEYFLLKAKYFADSLNLIDEKLLIYGNLGITKNIKGKYKESVEYYLSFIELARTNNNPEYISSGYNNIGIIYYQIGDTKVALDFYQKCVSIKNEFKIEKGLFTNYYNIGLCYIELKKYDEAFASFQYVINNCNNCPLNMIVDATYGLGKAAFSLLKYDEALQYLYSAAEMSLSISYYQTYTSANKLISEIFIIKKDFVLALEYLDRCNNIRDKYPNSVNFNNMLQYSKIYEELGDYKNALEYKNKYIAMKDSILSGEKISEVKNLLSDYQQAENKEIIKAKEIQVKRNRQFAIMFGIILVLLLVILLFAYRNIEIRKKLNDKLSNLVKERTSELNTLFYRTSHDLAGPIATLKGLVDLISNNASPENVQNYISKIDITTSRLETIIKRLESVSKIGTLRIERTEINIEELIKKLVEEINTTSIGIVKINTFGNPRIKTDTRLMDSIIRNVLENGFRFVDNRESVHELIITIIRNKRLKISISDNGKGIEAGNIDLIFDLFYVAHDRLKGSGIGLYQARLAAGRLNGTIQITHPKKPTTFEIMIPKV